MQQTQGQCGQPNVSPTTQQAQPQSGNPKDDNRCRNPMNDVASPTSAQQQCSKPNIDTATPRMMWEAQY